jgi:hypothetical protein
MRKVNMIELKNQQSCQTSMCGSFSDKQIEKLAHNNFPYGSTSPVGSIDRSLYENKKESFINGFKVSKNYR